MFAKQSKRDFGFDMRNLLFDQSECRIRIDEPFCPNLSTKHLL